MSDEARLKIVVVDESLATSATITSAPSRSSTQAAGSPYSSTAVGESPKNVRGAGSSLDFTGVLRSADRLAKSLDIVAKSADSLAPSAGIFNSILNSISGFAKNLSGKITDALGGKKAPTAGEPSKIITEQERTMAGLSKDKLQELFRSKSGETYTAQEVTMAGSSEGFEKVYKTAGGAGASEAAGGLGELAGAIGPLIVAVGGAVVVFKLVKWAVTSFIGWVNDSAERLKRYSALLAATEANLRVAQINSERRTAERIAPGVAEVRGGLGQLKIGFAELRNAIAAPLVNLIGPAIGSITRTIGNIFQILAKVLDPVNKIAEFVGKYLNPFRAIEWLVQQIHDAIVGRPDAIDDQLRNLFHNMRMPNMGRNTAAPALGGGVFQGV